MDHMPPAYFGGLDRSQATYIDYTKGRLACRDERNRYHYDYSILESKPPNSSIANFKLFFFFSLVHLAHGILSVSELTGHTRDKLCAQVGGRYGRAMGILVSIAVAWWRGSTARVSPGGKGGKLAKYIPTCVR